MRIPHSCVRDQNFHKNRRRSRKYREYGSDYNLISIKLLNLKITSGSTKNGYV